nr:ribonuclease H-like domain-containing protein [Tanacetum cinerariifolium]
MAFLSSPSSTNEVDTVSIQVNAASTPVSAVSSPNNTANLSDATVYAFLSNQPNGSQLVHEDIEKIHEDDLEEMDLKWQLALLSMRARRYFQRRGKKITINGSDTAGYDKTKVECFNCHKTRHFARECKSLRSQETRLRNQDSSRKTVIVEDTSSKAMVAIDEAGFDWSYMGDDKVPTNMALMAFSDSDNTPSLLALRLEERTKRDEFRLGLFRVLCMMKVHDYGFCCVAKNNGERGVILEEGLKDEDCLWIEGIWRRWEGFYMLEDEVVGRGGLSDGIRR